jgi:hypothetical protein
VVGKQNTASKDTQLTFGKWIFKELYNTAPAGMHNFKDVFVSLYAVQDFIHIEVKNLAMIPCLSSLRFCLKHLNKFYFIIIPRVSYVSFVKVLYMDLHSIRGKKYKYTNLNMKAVSVI